MICGRCHDDLVPAALTIHQGEYVCARDLYALALYQLANKTVNVVTW